MATANLKRNPSHMLLTWAAPTSRTIVNSLCSLEREVYVSCVSECSRRRTGWSWFIVVTKWHQIAKPRGEARLSVVYIHYMTRILRSEIRVFCRLPGSYPSIFFWLLTFEIGRLAQILFCPPGRRGLWCGVSFARASLSLLPVTLPREASKLEIGANCFHHKFS